MVNAAIKQAVIQQIADKITNKGISASWVEDTLCKLTGTKKVTGKRVPLTRTEIISGIEAAIKGALACIKVNSTIKELKEFINDGGSTFFKNCIKDVPVTRIEGELTVEEKTAALNSMLTSLTIEKLWNFLEQCTNHDPVEYSKKKHEEKLKKAEKKNTTPVKKTQYVTVTNEEAVQILAPYYTQLASGDNSIPECFKSATNATQAFQRFVFSHMNQANCDITNSISEPVYTAWKDANKDVTVTPDELARKQAIIDGYKASNPDYMETLKGWSNRPYIKCLLKKDEVKQEVKQEEVTTATTDADKEFEEVINELEKEQKALNA